MQLRRLAAAVLATGALALGVAPTATASAPQDTPAVVSVNAPGTGSDPGDQFNWIGQPTLLTQQSGIAPLFNRTWSFEGDFKASLTSSSFSNTARGDIKVTLREVSNCTSGFSKIYVTLRVQETVGWSTVPPSKVSFPCTQTDHSYTWDNARAGTYIMVFERSGPTGQDENTKHIDGTVYYW